MTAYTPGNPFAPKERAEPTPAPAPEPVDAPEVDQPARPVGDAVESPEKLLQRARMLAAGLQGHYSDADSLDDAIEAMKAMKAAQDALYLAYTTARNDMWENYGPGKHATETGRTFSFTKPSGSRSCDYTDLAAKFPEAYAECVTEKGPKPDAVGSLRLPKGAAK